MTYSLETEKKLYEMIEKAAQENLPVDFPVDVNPLLQVGSAPTGATFAIPGLYWMDEKRNVYQPWLQMEKRPNLLVPALYIAGTCTLDGFSSGDTSMLLPECRYKTII